MRVKKVFMLKLVSIFIISMFLGSCSYDDSPCYGYRDNYNELTEPAFLSDLNQWAFVLSDSFKNIDTFYIDSFNLETFISSDVGECGEDCETYLLKGFGKGIKLECLEMAETSNYNDYYNDDYFYLILTIDNKEFINIATREPVSPRVKYRNDSGLMVVKRSPYTLKRIK